MAQGAYHIYISSIIPLSSVKISPGPWPASGADMLGLRGAATKSRGPASGKDDDGIGGGAMARETRREDAVELVMDATLRGEAGTVFKSGAMLTPSQSGSASCRSLGVRQRTRSDP